MIENFDGKKDGAVHLDNFRRIECEADALEIKDPLTILAALEEADEETQVEKALAEKMETNVDVLAQMPSLSQVSEPRKDQNLFAEVETAFQKGIHGNLQEFDSGYD